MWMLLLPLVALADIAPPPGYVETCTAERHTSAKQTCRECSAYFGGREPCEALEGEGYIAVCQTYGASTWTEVLCRATEPGGTVEPAPSVPVSTAEPAPKGSRCDHGGGSWSLAGWIALGAVLRRRRWRVECV